MRNALVDGSSAFEAAHAQSCVLKIDVSSHFCDCAKFQIQISLYGHFSSVTMTIPCIFISKPNWDWFCMSPSYVSYFLWSQMRKKKNSYMSCFDRSTLLAKNLGNVIVPISLLSWRYETLLILFRVLVLYRITRPLWILNVEPKFFHSTYSLGRESRNEVLFGFL